MRVRDVMSRSVVSVRPDTPLKAAARMMVERGISGVPVVDDMDCVVGVLSEADFVIKQRGAESIRHRPLARFIGDSPEAELEYAKVVAERVGAAMTSPAVVIEADVELRHAAAVMVDRGINRLPVIDGGRLVGIVTRADIMRAYLRSDDDLRSAILDRIIRDELWLDPADFEVEVDDGVVRLAGTVSRRSVADIVRRRVGREEGVVAVESALAWREDDTDLEAPEKDLVGPFVEM